MTALPQLPVHLLTVAEYDAMICQPPAIRLNMPSSKLLKLWLMSGSFDS